MALKIGIKIIIKKFIIFGLILFTSMIFPTQTVKNRETIGKSGITTSFTLFDNSSENQMVSQKDTFSSELNFPKSMVSKIYDKDQNGISDDFDFILDNLFSDISTNEGSTSQSNNFSEIEPLDLLVVTKPKSNLSDFFNRFPSGVQVTNIIDVSPYGYIINIKIEVNSLDLLSDSIKTVRKIATDPAVDILEGNYFIARKALDVAIPQGRVGYTNKTLTAGGYGNASYLGSSVWETFGITGDSNTTIAIIDDGLDDTHPDLGPGYTAPKWTQDVSELGSVSSGTQNQVHYNTPLSAAWTEINVTFSSSDVNKTYNFSLSWTGGENLDLYWYSPGTSPMQDGGGNDYVSRSFTSNNPENITGVTITKAGTWTLAVDMYSGGSSRDFTIDGFFSDLAWNNKIVAWRDFTSDAYATPWNGPQSASGGLGHGSHVAGIAAGKGVASTFSDGLYRGVAPDVRLVGARIFNDAGSSEGILSSLNWVLNQRDTYHTIVASNSWGSPDTAVIDTIINSLVSNGIIVVSAAGNDGANYSAQQWWRWDGVSYGTQGWGIGSPGRADLGITVAAVNDFSNITSYSTSGDLSTGSTIKPDISAPGGSSSSVGVGVSGGGGIFSIDSNDCDETVLADDYKEWSGTSMATPFVSGIASLVVDAMGGWTAWTSLDPATRALYVKNILLLTAVERTGQEGARNGITQNTPPLNRGEKDNIEGFGRINADAAVEAILMNLNPGENYVENLDATGMSGGNYHGKLASVRNINLNVGKTYEFFVNVPVGADFDLFLYNGTGDQYGQPIILAKSINVSLGDNEYIKYTPTTSGKFFLVVKAVNGKGSFQLGSVYNSLNVTSPVNSSLLIEPSIHKITWNSTGIISNISIELYENDVFVMEIITSTLNDGEYDWLVPNGLNYSIKYQIKIYDAENAIIFNFSEYFGIKVREITVISPEISTTWEANTTKLIEWTTTGIIANVEIDLFLNGSFVMEITASISNNGNYTWVLPDDLSFNTRYKIRIREVLDSTMFDFSDNFEILKMRTMDVIIPDSSSSWEVGSTHDIDWNSTGAIINVKIDLYLDGSFLTEIAASATNNGSFSWILPETVENNTLYQIRISDALDPAVYGVSDNFEALIMRSISVITPTNSNSWEMGTTPDIEWSSTGAISNVKIELYLDGSLELEITPSTTNDGSFSWNIPIGFTESTQYTILISDASDLTIYDESDNFEIEDLRSITVLIPADITSWILSSTEIIEWSSTGIIADVKIDLYFDGSFQMVIAASTPNDGSLSWEIPDDITSGNLYEIRISDISDTSMHGESAEFSITINMPYGAIPGYDQWIFVSVLLGISFILVKKWRKITP